MADKTGFKHITVGASDDDVVIVAGAPAISPAAGTAAHWDEAPAEPEPASASAAPARAEAPAKDSYQPTTLEDIEEAKMPLTQNIVIAAAAVAVVAFAVRYVLF